MIKSVTWNSLPAVDFAAGGYEALLVPAVGANLVRLFHVPTGTDILRTPREDEMDAFCTRPQIFGLPLLFPPNRIEDGRYTYGGRTYQFPITIPAQNNYHHGIIKTEPFMVASCQDGDQKVVIEAVYYSNAANGAIFNDFGHEFECVMRFELSATGLVHTVTFRNLSDSEMPVGV
ncbi:MAG: aldose 1-epimerase, partial [Rikenellaceae bacterium]|nr:aldose 1-epimerase [Rikenellaceae bacterium]